MNDRLRSSLNQNRAAGVVTLKIVPRPHDITVSTIGLLDEFVSSVGYKGLGERWRTIDYKVARSSLVDILHCDMAYDREVMSWDTAIELANQFLSQFDSDAQFFTNCDSLSWYPITSATFDRGVLGLDTTHIGILWIEDED